MPQWAVLHATTRVIRRVTTDADHAVAADEARVEVVGPPLDLAGGPWKLAANNQTKLPPTPQEIDEADVDESRVALKLQQRMTAYVNALDSLINDALTPPKLKALFQAMKNLRNP